MGAGRLIYGQSRRGRDTCRALIVAATLTLFAVGCGSGDDAATDNEKAADVEILNAALAQELTAVDAYTQGLPLLRGPLLAVGREFRAHEQEHADALIKAIRGLGGETEAEASELERPGPKSRAEFLALAYAQENAALASYLDAAPQLATAGPRALAASLAASHAQHLVVLRRGLGADLVSAAPEAFEPGDLPAPGEQSPDADGATEGQ